LKKLSSVKTHYNIYNMLNLSSTVEQTEDTVALCTNAIAAVKVTANESKSDGNTVFENKETEVEEDITSGESGETKMIVEKKVEEDIQVNSESETQNVCIKEISTKYIVSPEASLSKNSLKLVKLSEQVVSNIQKGDSNKTRIEKVLVKNNSLGTTSQTRTLRTYQTKSVIKEDRQTEIISTEKGKVKKVQKCTVEEKAVDYGNVKLDTAKDSKKNVVDKPQRQSKSIKRYEKPRVEEYKDSSLFSSNELYFAKRTATRRASTGSYVSECEMNSLIKVSKVFNPTYMKLRKRLKNVKSKLYCETKSFRAYKCARSRDAQKRQKGVGAIAERTGRLYAHRSIDFSKKSKRQRQDSRRKKFTSTAKTK